jgi:hypothetical protein
LRKQLGVQNVDTVVSNMGAEIIGRWKKDWVIDPSTFSSYSFCLGISGQQRASQDHLHTAQHQSIQLLLTPEWRFTGCCGWIWGTTLSKVMCWRLGLQLVALLRDDRIMKTLRKWDGSGHHSLSACPSHPNLSFCVTGPCCTLEHTMLYNWNSTASQQTMS